jgi:pimeloyl-ACP methyl ester carboxylesterase
VPFANHRGQRIHYTVDGAGPLVVLLQGILLDASCWKRTGIVEALTDNYRVACVDSLGHGLSDKPSHPALYDQAQRAGDITAVIDDVGCERAHLVGHSMGGWLAVGLAKYHPKRLLSLVVGGWDLLNGLPKGKNGPLSFDSFMAFARRTAPGLVAWITPESEPGCAPVSMRSVSSGVRVKPYSTSASPCCSGTDGTTAITIRCRHSLPPPVSHFWQRPVITLACSSFMVPRARRAFAAFWTA